MAIYREDIVNVELNSGSIFRSFLNHQIGEGDSGANRFGVRVFRGGEEVSVSGATCTGYFIRPEGDTVVITGTASGNTAYVDLPQACYTYEGQFSLAIKLAGGDVTGTMRIVDGVVTNTTTDTLIDPGTVIPSIEDLIEAIETAVASIPADYSDLWTSLAPAFSTSTAYKAGQFCTYDGGLYRFIADHEGTWAAGDAVKVSLGPEISDANAAINALADEAIAAFGLKNLSITDGGYIYKENGQIATSANYSHSGFTKIEGNGILFTCPILSNTTGLANVAAIAFYTDKDADTVMSDNYVSCIKGVQGEYRWEFIPVPAGANYFRVSFLTSASEGYKIVEIHNITAESDCVGEDTVEFPSSTQIIRTGIMMEPLTHYRVRIYTNRAGIIRMFPNSDSTHFVQLEPFRYDIIVYNNVDAKQSLALYNYNGTADVVTLKMFKIGSVVDKAENVPTKYTVGKISAEADFSSVTECFLALKDDFSPKIIEIWEGDYDIYQEYKDAEVPVYTGDDPAMEFMGYCVFIPPNSHVIGKGIVRLKWMPTKEANPEITWNQCYAVSPVNVLGNVTLENVEVHCKNGRYCIHDDPIGLAPYAGEMHKYINVRCYKYIGETDTSVTPNKIFGTTHTIGFGLNRSTHHQYENCVFVNEWTGRAFYGHSEISWNGVEIVGNKAGSMTFNNCVFDGVNTEQVVYLDNNGVTPKDIRMMFAGCSFNGTLWLHDAPNSFDCTLLNCGEVTMKIDDENNTFAPKAYRTEITVV